MIKKISWEEPGKIEFYAPLTISWWDSMVHFFYYDIQIYAMWRTYICINFGSRGGVTASVFCDNSGLNWILTINVYVLSLRK